MQYSEAINKASQMTKLQLKSDLGISKQDRGQSNFSKQRLVILFAEKYSN